MKKLLFFSLMTMTVSVFAQASEMLRIANPSSSNTITREYSSIKDRPAQTTLANRSTDYPTQIVRMHGIINGQTQTCEQVFEKIDVFFNKPISYDRFFYNTIVYCSYDSKTNFATSFTINSYFDPLNDEAIDYLKKYLAEHNGKDLLGLAFNVETAMGLVVSLDLDVGIEDENNDSSLMLLRHDNASHYFSNNYKMRLDLINDADRRLFTHDSNLVLPFIGQWLQMPAGMYLGFLSRANYVELRPELIFLMENNPKIFTPLLRLYHANHCSKYVNKHCL
jgi:hypothetical protein